MPDKCRLSDGDMIPGAERFELLGFLRRLYQNRTVNRACFHRRRYAFGNLALKVGCVFVFAVGQRDQHGIRHLVKVSVFNNREHQGIDRNVKIRPFKIHAVKNGFTVLIQRDNIGYFFVLVDFKNHAGIDVNFDMEC